MKVFFVVICIAEHINTCRRDHLLNVGKFFT